MVISKATIIEKPIAELKRRMKELKRLDMRIDDFGYNIYSYREIITDNKGYRAAGILKLETSDDAITLCTIIMTNNNDKIGDDWNDVLVARIASILDKVKANPLVAPYKTILSIRESSLSGMNDELEPFTVEPSRKEFLSERTTDFMYKIPKASDKVQKAHDDLKARENQVNAIRESNRVSANKMIADSRSRQSNSQQNNTSYRATGNNAASSQQSNKIIIDNSDAHERGAACDDDHIYNKDSNVKTPQSQPKKSPAPTANKSVAPTANNKQTNAKPVVKQPLPLRQPNANNKVINKRDDIFKL